jgi:hypothetical protein
MNTAFIILPSSSLYSSRTRCSCLFYQILFNLLVFFKRVSLCNTCLSVLQLVGLYPSIYLLYFPYNFSIYCHSPISSSFHTFNLKQFSYIISSSRFSISYLYLLLFFLPYSLPICCIPLTSVLPVLEVITTHIQMVNVICRILQTVLKSSVIIYLIRISSSFSRIVGTALYSKVTEVVYNRLIAAWTEIDVILTNFT